MAEISRPWDGTVMGDAGPYSDDQWTDVWGSLFGPVVAQRGVFIDQLNDLVLAGLAASPVTINTGRALVNGTWYQSDASVDVAIPTPAANPRIDRIVLRKTWATQTIRVTRIAGAEGAVPAPPALVQNDGVTWDLPLWQVLITVAPVLSVYRDERTFIGQYVPTGITMERVYLEEEFFLPSTGLVNGDFLNSFEITLGGNGAIGSLAAFGAGAAALSTGAAAAANVVEVKSKSHRPDLINGHLIMRVKVPATDAEMDRVIGFSDVPIALLPNNGVFFRANGAANWFAITRAGGVETATDTGQALDNTWRKFEIRQTDTSVVVFLIDDVVVATPQTNIPAADLLLRGGIVDSGAGTAGAADYMNLDLYRLRGDR